MGPTLIGLLQEAVVKYPSLAALRWTKSDGEPSSLTYVELYTVVRELGSGLISVGLQKGDRVAVVAENGWRWLATDLAILGCGAADVPLSARISDRELEYVLGHAECEMAVVESEAVLARLVPLRNRLPRLRRIIVMELAGPRPRLDGESGRVLVHPWDEVVKKGRDRLAKGGRQFDLRAAGVTAADTATLLYASTPGLRPRGVMLSHGNIMHNVSSSHAFITPQPGTSWLSVLPVWQPLERIAEYCSISFGCTTAYSLASEWRLFDDLKATRAAWLVLNPSLVEELARGIEKRVGPLGSVAIRFEKFYAVFSGFIAGRYPRYRREERALEIFAAILPLLLLAPGKVVSHFLLRSRVRTLLGGGLRAVICAGPLSPSLDRTFSAIGVPVLQGYGLPEAGPVVSLRPEKAPVLGTVGRPLPLTEVQILDDEGRPLAPGHPGRLRVRGPQVMQGYWRDEAGTQEILSRDGWLATGDTAALTLDGDLVITGRSQQTITLRSGERFEPGPVEQALLGSPYVQDAVVVGDGREAPGLLVVPAAEELARWAGARGIPFADGPELVHNPAVFRFYQEEIQGRLAAAGVAIPGGRAPRVALLPARSEAGAALHTRGREAVGRMYAGVIERLYRS